MGKFDDVKKSNWATVVGVLMGERDVCWCVAGDDEYTLPIVLVI